jgi:hypothetical protein
VIIPAHDVVDIGTVVIGLFEKNLLHFPLHNDLGCDILWLAKAIKSLESEVGTTHWKFVTHCFLDGVNPRRPVLTEREVPGKNVILFPDFDLVLYSWIGRRLIEKVIFGLCWTDGNLGWIKCISAVENRTEHVDLETVHHIRITSTIPTSMSTFMLDVLLDIVD